MESMLIDTLASKGTVYSHQPLESTHIENNNNISSRFHSPSVRSSRNESPELSAPFMKSLHNATKPEQTLYATYAQTLAETEITQDWNSWIETMAINCRNCCSEAEIIGPQVYRTTKFSQSDRTLRLLQKERDSWILWSRARDTLNNTQHDLPNVIPNSSDRLIVEHHLLLNPHMRMAKAVLSWLHSTKLDEQYQTSLKMSMSKLEPKRFYWEKTRHFLKASYNENTSNPYVTALDFDAPHKQKRRLCDNDEQEENDLLQIVFWLLRVGEYSKAKNLCKSTGYHWLAAILCANELYHDENYYCSESSKIIYPVEGNQRRIQWIETMYQLCADVRLKLYERAIYGLLCGRIDAILPVCKTYEDYLWAYISCYIEQEIHYILVTAHQHELTDDEKRRILDTTSCLSITMIFDEILSNSPKSIQNESLTQFNQIQKFIILDDYDQLLQTILTIIRTNNYDGSLLRFATHVCLFLFDHSKERTTFDQKWISEIIGAYIHHLIELALKDFVCYYISKLPTNIQITTMAAFLDTLMNRNEKEYYLKQAFTFKIDIDASLIILANKYRQQTFIQQTLDYSTYNNNDNECIISASSIQLDENDLKQLEVLKLLTTFLSVQTLEGLRYSNRICRSYLNETKYDGIRTALSYFPHDIHLMDTINNVHQKSSDDIREFKSFGTFITALEAINRWSELHQKQQVRNESLSIDLTMDDDDDNNALDRSYLNIVVKACYDVLDFSQGFMNDIQTDSHNDESRTNEMLILRQKCVSMIACTLFRIFDLSKEHRQSTQLLMFLSDGNKKLYSLFPKEALTSILLFTERASELCLNKYNETISFE